jgi:hypothetical protein
MHGAAFVANDGAWMVLAEKGGGKSSTMAALFAAGYSILADDLVVLEGGLVMPGPRFVDLKEDPESVVGKPLAHELLLERRRIILPDAGLPVQLEGALLLEWGERVEVLPVPVVDRLALSIGHRTLNETDPRLLLGLARTPMWVIRRPPDIRCLPEVVAQLARLVGEVE